MLLLQILFQNTQSYFDHNFETNSFYKFTWCFWIIPKQIIEFTKKKNHKVKIKLFYALQIKSLFLIIHIMSILVIFCCNIFYKLLNSLFFSIYLLFFLWTLQTLDTQVLDQWIWRWNVDMTTKNEYPIFYIEVDLSTLAYEMHEQNWNKFERKREETQETKTH